MKRKAPQVIKGAPVKRPRNPVARALAHKSGAGRHGPTVKAKRQQDKQVLRREISALDRQRSL